MTQIKCKASFERQYDLTPLGLTTDAGASSRFSLDPWENDSESKKMVKEQTSTSNRSNQSQRKASDTSPSSDDTEEIHFVDESPSVMSTYLDPEEIHLSMEDREEEIAQLRLLAGKLSADWRAQDFVAPALARRMRDFHFAQEKRRKKYGDERPWGILGLYDHLSAIRIDVQWAEDAAWRRANGEPYLSWADFDESKKGGKNRPYFTYVLLFVCTANMIASIAANDWTVESLDENPMIGPSAATLIRMGAKDSYLIVHAGEGWRLLTSTILHAGLVHYFINMLALWFVGGAIEMSHGWISAMIIFSSSAIGGIILSAIFLPEFITVGASGGIFGFIGACLADIIMNWKLLFDGLLDENGKKHQHTMVVVVLLFDIALNSIIGLTPYVDNFTHLGGMAYGFLCGLSTIERLSKDFFGLEESWMVRAKNFCVRFFGIIVTVVFICVTAIILMGGDGVTTPCTNCSWLSCVPFPPWQSQSNKWWYCDDCGRITAEIISEPYLHLELDCPGGTIGFVNVTTDQLDRGKLEQSLPSYCRQYCPIKEL
jgi:membrane associated rhomboid family serine protease